MPSASNIQPRMKVVKRDQVNEDEREIYLNSDSSMNLGVWGQEKMVI